MKRVKARKDEISGRSKRSVEEWLRGLKNCTVIQGHARFESARTVAVNDEVLVPEKIFINVSGRAAVPTFPGIHDVPFFTNSIGLTDAVPPAVSFHLLKQDLIVRKINSISFI
jgi:pyruvate/2-oxoglutarate dehydrogenase complex dihydrolipoamide dehydrogenase (E3) component